MHTFIFIFIFKLYKKFKKVDVEDWGQYILFVVKYRNIILQHLSLNMVVLVLDLLNRKWIIFLVKYIQFLLKEEKFLRAVDEFLRPGVKKIKYKFDINTFSKHISGSNRKIKTVYFKKMIKILNRKLFIKAIKDSNNFFENFETLFNVRGGPHKLSKPLMY